MCDNNLFLAGEHAKFYLTGNSLQGTSFAVKPATTEDKRLMEQMNGSLNLLHQHMRLQQYKPKRFIPEVTEFNAKTGELVLTVPTNLTSALPTALLDFQNIIVDYGHAAWITEQAFQLASLAHGAGMVLPFSTENFLLCYESKSFVLLDWTMTQIYKNGQIDETVAKEQVVDLANLLLSMVDYAGIVSKKVPDSCYLNEFINEAADGMFSSVAEAMQKLNNIL